MKNGVVAKGVQEFQSFGLSVHDRLRGEDGKFQKLRINDRPTSQAENREQIATSFPYLQHQKKFHQPEGAHEEMIFHEDYLGTVNQWHHYQVDNVSDSGEKTIEWTKPMELLAER